MVTKLVALIFASFFIQDAVSSEQALGDFAQPPHDDRVPVTNSLNEAAVADQQNSGKIWNWTFGNTASPATNEGTLNTENGFPVVDDRAFNVKKNPFKLSDDKMVADDNNVSAGRFKESFVKKSRDFDARVDPRYSVPNRNLIKLRNQLNNNNNRKYESEEYDFDESEDDESFDSQSGSSQSYDDDDDDNDLSRENKYPRGYEFAPDTQMRNERYPMRGSRAAPLSGYPPMEQPAMQTRSLQMQTLGGHPRLYGSVSM